MTGSPARPGRSMIDNGDKTMIRPVSITRYERLYLASFVIGLIVSAMSWGPRRAMVAATPMLAKIGWILPTFEVAGIVITLTLWYFTVRAPSGVARWVVIVLAALSAIGVAISLVQLATGHAVPSATLGLSIVASVVYIGAALQLLKPDAKLWFDQAGRGHAA
ncbi:hypothetical protein ASG20_00555 [Sphingomonas sp. Leaf198]|nr:hypothetical protein [Sphingomonas sp. Leaf205]KQS50669.1 hypothetical protein ASG20_00555 [Sphingomonas sp. Leaf198]